MDNAPQPDHPPINTPPLGSTRPDASVTNGPRDSRLESFLRKAGGILAADKRWSPQTQIKLRTLADQLMLPEDLYDQALSQLARPTHNVPETRWESAFIEYLEKQFSRLPGKILSLPKERKAIQFGRKRFQMGTETCEHWIEIVATRMGIARVSDSDAIAHAQAEVARLTDGQLFSDEGLEDQIVAAAQRWGVDEKKAKRLLDSQLAVNRSKHRRRWWRLAVLQIGSLSLGVLLIAATFFLARIIGQQLGDNPPPKQNLENQTQPNPARGVPPLSTETLAAPTWWTDASQSLAVSLASNPATKRLPEQLKSNDTSQRITAYAQVIQHLSHGNHPHLPLSLSAPNLASPEAQQAITEWFIHDPDPRVAAAIAQQLAGIRQQLSTPDSSVFLTNTPPPHTGDREVSGFAQNATDAATTPAVGVIQAFLLLCGIDNLVLQMDAEAGRMSTPRRRELLQSQFPFLLTSNLGASPLSAKNLAQRTQQQRQSLVWQQANQMSLRLQSLWPCFQHSAGPKHSANESPETESENQSHQVPTFANAPELRVLKDEVLQVLSRLNDPQLREPASTNFLAGLAGIGHEWEAVVEADLLRQIDSTSAKHLGRIVELITALKCQMSPSPLASQLQGKLMTKVPNPQKLRADLLGFQPAFRELRLWQIALKIETHPSEFQRQVRLAYVREINQEIFASSESAEQHSQIATQVTLCILLLEGRWDLRLFDEAALAAMNSRATGDEDKNLPSTEPVNAVTQDDASNRNTPSAATQTLGEINAILTRLQRSDLDLVQYSDEVQQLSQVLEMQRSASFHLSSDIPYQKILQIAATTSLPEARQSVWRAHWPRLIRDPLLGLALADFLESADSESVQRMVIIAGEAETLDPTSDAGQPSAASPLDGDAAAPPAHSPAESLDPIELKIESLARLQTLLLQTQQAAGGLELRTAFSRHCSLRLSAFTENAPRSTFSGGSRNAAASEIGRLETGRLASGGLASGGLASGGTANDDNVWEYADTRSPVELLRELCLQADPSLELPSIDFMEQHFADEMTMALLLHQQWRLALQKRYSTIEIAIDASSKPANNTVPNPAPQPQSRAERLWSAELGLLRFLDEVLAEQQMEIEASFAAKIQPWKGER